VFVSTARTIIQRRCWRYSPREWAQIIGKGRVIDPEFPLLARSKDAVAHLNAAIQITQNETLLTSADAATTEQYFCLNQTQGPSIPIKLH